MANLRVALIGCGGIADAYLAAMDRIDGASICAVVDPDDGARADAMARTGAKGAADLSEISAYDAALLLTPPVTHEDLAVQALDQGAHVLCEKPLAPTVAAADRMLAAAAAAGRRLMMGSKFRYTPDVSEARRLLDQRCCGDVVLYDCLLYTSPSPRDRG